MNSNVYEIEKGEFSHLEFGKYIFWQREPRTIQAKCWEVSNKRPCQIGSANALVPFLPNIWCCFCPGISGNPNRARPVARRPPGHRDGLRDAEQVPQQGGAGAEPAAAAGHRQGAEAVPGVERLGGQVLPDPVKVPPPLERTPQSTGEYAYSMYIMQICNVYYA